MKIKNDTFWVHTVFKHLRGPCLFWLLNKEGEIHYIFQQNTEYKWVTAENNYYFFTLPYFA